MSFIGNLAELFGHKCLTNRRTLRTSSPFIDVLEVRQLLTVYSIDPVNGDDANPGTLEQPFRTARNLSYAIEGAPPTVQLQPGDVVYLRDGVHDWTELINEQPDSADFAGTGLLLVDVHGSADAPIRITAYPGERPIVTAKEEGIENNVIMLLQSSHVEISGLEVTDTFGNGIWIASSSDVELFNNHVHDIDGFTYNNIAGIYVTAGERIRIYQNLVHDNYDRQESTPNSRNIVVFAGEGNDIEVFRNKVFNTPLASGQTTGSGIWVKHWSEIPGATFSIYDNIIRDVSFASVGGQSSGVNVYQNLIENSGPYLILGGSNTGVSELIHERVRIEANTFTGTDGIESFGLRDFNIPASDFIQFRNNIVVTNKQSYHSEDGILRLELYGTDELYEAMMTPQNLGFSGNVYYNTPADPVWNVFSGNGDEFGQLGSSLTFAEWQSLGIDTTSIVADPQLDSHFVPQNSAAANAGWLSGSEERLVMYVKNDKFRETDGANASSVELFRTGNNFSQPLTVNLSVSDASEISVPSTVTFPAGVSRLRVPISALNDSAIEPTRGVQIFATTSSGLSGSEWVRVLQEEGSNNGPDTFNADGTSGSDAFVLTYSGNTPDSTVNVSVSSNGDPALDLGTFPMSTVINVNGFGGNDSVRIVGSDLDDTLEVSNAGVLVNGSSVVLNSVESQNLSGGAGSDIYRFDADAALGLWTLDESGGGMDTIDLSPTTTVGLSLNMALAGTQSVHPTNLRLSLGSGATIENAIGGAEADNLTGNSQNNTLKGGAGDDRLNGGTGSDSLFGGANNDTYVFTTAAAGEADQVAENTNEGIDTLDFSALTSSVTFHLGSLSIQPVHTNRTLKLNSPNTFENSVGGSGADSLAGNGWNNTLKGGAGDDRLSGGAGSDSLFGGANNDTYLFTTAAAGEADQVAENTNEGIDTLDFSALTSSVTFHLGSLSIQPVHTNRTLKLNSPNTFENSVGGSGADSLAGNGWNNTLKGGAGDDRLSGGAGSDSLFGGANNDTYLFTTAAASEADQVTENTNDGIDTLNFAALTSSVVLNLGSTAIQTVHTNRTLRLNSISTSENAIGGSGSDTLIGNALPNRLTGGNGDNILVGLDGSDILEAGSGRDILIGGLGLDTLNGGSNDDILIAGRTASDTSLANLNTLRTQWISANTYAVRVANLRAGVGSPVVSLKARTNVLNDTAAVDRMTGGGGTDWYFRALDDVITDLLAAESIDML